MAQSAGRKGCWSPRSGSTTTLGDGEDGGQVLGLGDSSGGSHRLTVPPPSTPSGHPQAVQASWVISRSHEPRQAAGPGSQRVSGRPAPKCAHCPGRGTAEGGRVWAAPPGNGLQSPGAGSTPADSSLDPLCPVWVSEPAPPLCLAPTCQGLGDPWVSFHMPGSEWPRGQWMVRPLGKGQREQRESFGVKPTYPAAALGWAPGEG